MHKRGSKQDAARIPTCISNNCYLFILNPVLQSRGRIPRLAGRKMTEFLSTTSLRRTVLAPGPRGCVIYINATEQPTQHPAARVTTMELVRSGAAHFALHLGSVVSGAYLSACLSWQLSKKLRRDIDIAETPAMSVAAGRGT